MTFTTENKKIEEIFQRPFRYIIPRYQREYVWTEQNWSELLTDVRFTLQEGSNITWSHFLGTIVLNYIPNERRINPIAGIHDYEIIDGQQRITTLYILLLSIYNRFKELNTYESKLKLNYLYNTFIISLSAESSPTIMIYNEKYNDDFKKIIDFITSIDSSDLDQNNRFYKLFNYFYKELNSYDFIELNNFLEKLLNVNIVEIISDQEEEIYNIFEVLNARGQKLKQIELLKNHIMKYITPREDAFIDDVKEKWNTIEDYSRVTANPDDLIEHFAKCFIKKNADNSESVYKLIKNEVPISQLDKLLNSLKEFSIAHEYVNNNNSQNNALEYFNIKRNRQIRSVLSAIVVLKNAQIISEEIMEKSFNNIRNFFFIFNALQQTSNQTHKIVSDTAYSIYYCETEIDFKFVITKFFIELNKKINTDNFIDNLYSNQTLKYSLKNTQLKRSNNRTLVKYILINYLSKMQNDTILDNETLTIEHLINDDGSIKNAELGNLTLTTGSLNSNVLGNKSISEKVSLLMEHSSIKGNHELNNYLVNDDTFNIDRRNKDIANSLLNDIFNFDPEIFHLNEYDILTYFNQKEVVKDTPSLYKLILKKGKSFETALNNDPNLLSEKAKYNLLVNARNETSK